MKNFLVEDRAFLALTLLVLALVYLPIFSILPYNDDMNYYQFEPVSTAFAHPPRYYPWLRIDHLPINLNTRLFPLGVPYLILIFQYLFYGASVVLFFSIAKKLFAAIDRKLPYFLTLGWAFMSVHVQSLFQVDTLSQTAVVTFSLALFLIVLNTQAGKISLARWGLISLITLLLFVSKESAFALALFLAPSVYIWNEFFGPNRPLSLAKGPGFKIQPRFLFNSSMILASSLLACATYLYIRDSLGLFLTRLPNADPENVIYTVRNFFVHGFRNFILLSGSTFYLGNELDFFNRTFTSWLTLPLGLLLTLISLLAMPIGIARSGRPTAIYLLSLCGLSVLLFSAAFVIFILFANRVNELYVIQISPFYALGFLSLGLLGLGKIWPQRGFYFQCGFTAVLLLMSIISIETKLALAKNAGKQNSHMMADYLEWRNKLRPVELAAGVELVFREEDLNTRFGKSVFFRSCREVFTYLPLAIDRGEASHIRTELKDYRIKVFGIYGQGVDSAIPQPYRYLVSFHQNEIGLPFTGRGDCRYIISAIE